MENVMISIIVPAYNSEKCIDGCLQSILEQSFRNIEVIVIDDGSVDRTGEICDEYAKNDERIYVIHKKNEGVYKTRAMGVSCSKGSYIMFVDHDDSLEADILQRAYEGITQNNADILCFNYCYSRRENLDKLRFFISKQEIIDTREALCNIMLPRKLNGDIWAKLYKAELFAGSNNIFYEKWLGEFLTVAELFKRAERILLMPIVGYLYSSMPESQSHRRRVHPREEEYYEIAQQFAEEMITIYPDFKKEAKYFSLNILLYVCGKMEKDTELKRTDIRFIKVKKEIRKNTKNYLFNRYFSLWDRVMFILAFTNTYRVINRCYLMLRNKN